MLLWTGLVIIRYELSCPRAWHGAAEEQAVSKDTYRIRFVLLRSRVEHGNGIVQIFLYWNILLLRLPCLLLMIYFLGYKSQVLSGEHTIGYKASGEFLEVKGLSKWYFMYVLKELYGQREMSICFYRNLADLPLFALTWLLQYSYHKKCTLSMIVTHISHLFIIY